MTSELFRIIPLNTRTLLLEWRQQPSDKLLGILLSFKVIIEKEVKVSGCIIGYKALLVHLNEDVKNLSWWNHHLNKIQNGIRKKKLNKGKLWKIPVCYEANYGPDLAPLSDALKLKIDELIQLHSQTRYRLCFLGFLPGFLYLNGLNKRLHFPRKEKPQLKVSKGSVGIGGKQTGIYPNNSPGGWHLIGNTPIPLFDVKQRPPCFASPGDWIVFEPINEKTYRDIKKEINKGHFKFMPHD